MTPVPRSFLRALVAAVAVSLLAGLLATTAPAVAAARYLCKGYDGCVQEGYSHFGYKRASATMWWGMYTGHNCTNYVAYRMVRGGMSPERPWSGSGMAYNWGRVNSSLTDGTPMVGAVAWWEAGDGVGSGGHVAYVQQVLSNRKIVVSEDVWGGDFSWRVITKRGVGWPTGFIHFNDRSVRPVAAPQVSGDPAVGAPLTVSVGRWKPASDVAVQWRSGSAPIPGATGTSFTPTPAQLRTRITVRVSATARGYLPGRAVSARTVRVARGTMTPATTPTLTGTARVGEEVVVSGGTASPRAGSRFVRWYADGVRVPQQATNRLTMTPAMLGKRITATVVLEREAYEMLKLDTRATAAVAPGRIDVDQPFRLTGSPRYGRLLSVEPGVVTPADATARYTWLRDGRPISGARGTTYRLGAADVGREVSVRVELRRNGYADKLVELPSTGIVTTRPRLELDAVGGARRAVAVLRVTAPGVDRPTGPVVVRIAGREVRGVVEDGKVRVVVRGIAPGRYLMRVAYLGTARIEARSVSDRVRVRRN